MKIIKRGINAVIPFLLANIYLLARCPEWNIPLMPLIVVVFIAVYVLLTAMPLLGLKNIQSKGIRRCQRGCENLYSFLAATVMSVAVLILMLVHVIDVGAWTWKNWVLYILTAVAVLAVTFWVGIIRIYVSSRQLGIKWRVIGILCGWIPVVHLIVLGKLISLASGETVLENEKIIKDKARQADRVCATRYPILKDITLNLEPGHIYGIIGPNGAGKSSFLRHVLAFLKTESKESMKIGDVPADDYPRKKLARLLSFVPQKTDIETDFTNCFFITD